ncbi:WD40 repeat domain-containing protein, partial [Rhizobium ruizarguesonis]
MVLRGHEGAVMSAVFSPDGSLVATGSLDDTARIWDSATGEQLHVLNGHSAVLFSVAFSPDGKRIVTVSADRTTRVWDVATAR